MIQGHNARQGGYKGQNESVFVRITRRIRRFVALINLSHQREEAEKGVEKVGGAIDDLGRLLVGSLRICHMRSHCISLRLNLMKKEGSARQFAKTRFKGGETTTAG